MNVLRLVVAGAAVCALASGVAAEEKKADNAKLIVGTWEVVKADANTLPVGSVVEYGKDGKSKVTFKMDGKDMTFDSTYKVEGNKYTITFKLGDAEQKMTINIKKLDDTTLLTESDGVTVEFKKKKK